MDNFTFVGCQLSLQCEYYFLNKVAPQMCVFIFRSSFFRIVPFTCIVNDALYFN